MDGAGAGLYSKRLSSAWSSGRRVPLANHHIQVLILVLLFCFLLLMMKALKVMFICERKAHDDKKWLMKTLFPWWIDFAASTSGIQRLPYLFRIVTIPTYSPVILFLHSAMFGILCSSGILLGWKEETDMLALWQPQVKPAVIAHSSSQSIWRNV